MCARAPSARHTLSNELRCEQRTNSINSSAYFVTFGGFEFRLHSFSHSLVMMLWLQMNGYGVKRNMIQSSMINCIMNWNAFNEKYWSSIAVANRHRMVGKRSLSVIDTRNQTEFANKNYNRRKFLIAFESDDDPVINKCVIVRWCETHLTSLRVVRHTCASSSRSIERTMYCIGHELKIRWEPVFESILTSF